MMRRPRRSTLFPTTTLSRSLGHVFQLSLGAEASSRYPRLRHADFPLWWTEGLAEYFSTGEDTRDEMVLRDLTVAGRLPGPGELAFAAGRPPHSLCGLVPPLLGGGAR